MCGCTIIHAMNTVFGKADQFGARSMHVASRAGATVEVFASGVAQRLETDVGDLVRVHRIALSPAAFARKAAFHLLRDPERKRRAVWADFDDQLARGISRLPAGKFTTFHTWEFAPKAIEAFRSANPDGLVFRDVVINRRNEYWSGTSIDIEDRYADFFVSPSTFSTRCLTSWGIAPEKVVEIPFGVDSALFRPAPRVTALPFRFAFAGGVSKRKGVDTLLRAWDALALPDAELHLYGRVRDDVRATLATARSVVCHGHVYLPAELPFNHAFVFPSTLEGSAKSVYEALACGLATVTTDESGSIVRDGIDGFIVPSGDVDALVDKMRRLYDDAALRERMAASARARAEEFTWDRYAQAVLSAYSACARLKRGGCT